MIKILAIVATAALVGCVSPRQNQIPLNVAMLPHDCQNRQIMLDWLDGQARLPQQRGETDREYTRSRNEIRKKIWDLRYHCQPV